MDIKILVATHKKLAFLPDDDVYMPLHVGRAGAVPTLATLVTIPVPSWSGASI